VTCENRAVQRCSNAHVITRQLLLHQAPQTVESNPVHNDCDVPHRAILYTACTTKCHCPGSCGANQGQRSAEGYSLGVCHTGGACKNNHLYDTHAARPQRHGCHPWLALAVHTPHINKASIRLLASSSSSYYPAVQLKAGKTLLTGCRQVRHTTCTS
jgi:hypothetical protein